MVSCIHFKDLDSSLDTLQLGGMAARHGCSFSHRFTPYTICWPVFSKRQQSKRQELCHIACCIPGVILLASTTEILMVQRGREAGEARGEASCQWASHADFEKMDPQRGGGGRRGGGGGREEPPACASPPTLPEASWPCPDWLWGWSAAASTPLLTALFGFAGPAGTGVCIPCSKPACPPWLKSIPLRPPSAPALPDGNCPPVRSWSGACPDGCACP